MGKQSIHFYAYCLFHRALIFQYHGEPWLRFEDVTRVMLSLEPSSEYYWNMNRANFF